MDFSSKLIIKARLGDDVRKIPVHTEVCTNALIHSIRLGQARLCSRHLIIAYNSCATNYTTTNTGLCLTSTHSVSFPNFFNFENKVEKAQKLFRLKMLRAKHGNVHKVHLLIIVRTCFLVHYVYNIYNYDMFLESETVNV